MRQRAVEMVLARQLASGLSVPVLLLDERGDLLYINEPAEEIFGRRFDEIDSLPLEERSAILSPRDRDGRPRPASQLPGVMAMRERRPVHAEFWINGLDGRPRPTESTAIPIEGSDTRIVGAFVLIWVSELPGVEALRATPSVPIAGHPIGSADHD